MSHYEENGKFYKKTRSTKNGEDMICEVKQCECGGWASVKLLKHRSHIFGHQHTKWVRDNTPAKPPKTLDEKIEDAKKQVKEWESSIQHAQKCHIRWQTELAKLYEKKNDLR